MQLKAESKLTKLHSLALNKMASSHVAKHVSDSITELSEQQVFTNASVGILGMLQSNASSNPADFTEHVATLRECPQAKVSVGVELLAFHQQLQLALTLNEIGNACNLCLSGSEAVRNLIDSSCNIEEISRVAEGTFLDSILVLATSGLANKDNVRRPPAKCTTKLAMASIIETMQAHATQELFLARRVCDTEMEDLPLLVPAKAALAKVQDFIERYDKRKSEKKDMLCDDDVGPLGSFLFDGVIGKKLGRLCPRIVGTPDG